MKYVFSLLFCLGAFCAIGQDALMVGDTLSQQVYNDLLRYEEGNKTKNDKEPKILMFDFWSTTCTSCIMGMPKLAELQRKYPLDLKIFLVTKNKTAIAEAFLSKRPYLKTLGLPILTGDTILSKFFPHRIVPHIVWIGKDRIVKAITFPEFSTDQTVETLIKNKSINLPLSVYPIHDFRKTFLTENRIDKSMPFTLTAIAGFIGRGMGGGSTFPGIPGYLKVVTVNSTLMAMYRDAYNADLNRGTVNNSGEKVLLNVKDPSAFFPDSTDVTKNKYCYETIIPAIPGEDGEAGRLRLLNKMKTDLDQFFNLKSRMDTISINCYIISFKPALQPKGKPDIIYELDRTRYICQPVSYILAYHWRPELADKPVFFEGDLKEMRTVILKQGYADFTELKEDWLSKGFIFREETRTIPMLVISDR